MATLTGMTRFAQLSPRDTAITLRSLGRRVTQAVAPVVGSAELQARIDAAGPNGDSLSGLVDLMTRMQGFLSNELGKSLDQKDPLIAKAVGELDQLHFVEDRPVPLTVGLESVATDSEQAGRRVEDTSGADLARVVSVVGGGSITPLEIAQQQARTGVASLKQIEDQVSWLKQTSR